MKLAKREDIFPDFLVSLPTAGRNGTLASRFQHPPLTNLQDRIRAKTGTLGDAPTVASMSGYLFHPRHGLLAFTVIQNADPQKKQPTLDEMHDVQEEGLWKIYQN